jgi:lambda repressor-like predicted transcriptional regulator
VDVAAWRRKRRVLARVTRAAWRLEQAERERAWAIAAAKAEGASIRDIAQAAGLSPSRVHQLVTGTDVDALDTALGALRAAGWPTPEDPGISEGDLAGRDDIAGRLDDEVEWIRQCADWLEHLQQEPYPTVINLRPEADWPRRYHVVADLPRVVAILRRIAYDVAELARDLRSPWMTEPLDDGAPG